MSDEYEYDVEHWNQRHEFYGSIRQGISLWSSMETTIVEIAAHLLGTTEHKTGLVFYSIMNFYTWLSIIEEIFALEPKFEPLRGDWGQISDKLRGLNYIRVRLAHHTAFDGSDYRDAPTLKPGKYDARKKSKKHSPLTNAEIVAYINETLHTGRELYALRDKMGFNYGEGLPAFHEKPAQ